MARMAVQLIGFFLGLLGLFGTLLATVMPQWRRRAYVGSNIITATGYMKGLWMECLWHSTGIYQCQFHRSLLALPADLQAARALMIISCFASMLAAAVSAAGMTCTRFLDGSPAKSSLATTGGICFAVAGLLSLITVSWTTDSVVRDFRNPMLPGAMKYEIGHAVYLGFISAVLSMAGGGALCLSCRSSREPSPYPARVNAGMRRPRPYRTPAVHNHVPSRFSASTSGYTLSDYV